MTASSPALPTDAELQILRFLWTRGPSTVREVHEELYRDTDVGYTTALKLLQNMLGKGYVTRDEEQRQHRYAAAVQEEETMRDVVRRLIDKSFEGSAAALAMHALGAKQATAGELAELRRLIEELESGESRTS